MLYTAEIFHLTFSIYSHSLFPTMINKEIVFFFGCKQVWFGLLLYKVESQNKKSQTFSFYMKHQVRAQLKSQCGCKSRALEDLAK